MLYIELMGLSDSAGVMALLYYKMGIIQKALNWKKQSDAYKEKARNLLICVR